MTDWQFTKLLYGVTALGLLLFWCLIIWMGLSCARAHPPEPAPAPILYPDVDAVTGAAEEENS